MSDARQNAQRTVIEAADLSPRRRLRWNDGYALVRLSSRGTPLDVPCPVEILDGHGVAGHGDTILIGEQGSGIEDLLSWWFERARALGNAVVLLDADKPSRPAMESFPSPIEVTTQDLVKQQLARFFEAAGNGAPGAFEHLDAAVGALGPGCPLQVLIRRFTRVRGRAADPAMEVAQSLRSYREQQHSRHTVADPSLRIVIGSASDSSFMDVATGSGYVTLCNEYRLPALDEDDIAALARHSLQPMALEPRMITQILDGTGGQPRLVEDVLQRLHVWQGRGMLPGVALADALSELRRHSPAYTGDWTRDLEQLLRRKSGIGKTLRGYADGQRLHLGRRRLNDDDRALYVAGWLGPDRDDTWGMRSPIHRHLALQVLDRLR
jgi:hypothetical protein